MYVVRVSCRKGASALCAVRKTFYPFIKIETQMIASDTLSIANALSRAETKFVGMTTTCVLKMNAPEREKRETKRSVQQLQASEAATARRVVLVRAVIPATDRSQFDPFSGFALIPKSVVSPCLDVLAIVFGLPLLVVSPQRCGNLVADLAPVFERNPPALLGPNQKSSVLRLDLLDNLPNQVLFFRLICFNMLRMVFLEDPPKGNVPGVEHAGLADRPEDDIPNARDFDFG